MADSTRASQKSAWKAFFRFLVAFGWSPYDISEAFLIRFATWMYMEHFNYGSIRCYVSSLPALYANVGIHLEVGKVAKPSLGRCLQGIRRISGDVPCPKRHITPDILRRMFLANRSKTVKDLALQAAVSVGFFSFLRSGNLVPKTKGSWKPGCHLARRDVTFVNRGALLSIRNTKTHQFGNVPFVVPVPVIPNIAFCPVSCLKTLFAAYIAPPDVPLFSYAPGKWITYSDLRLFIKELVALIGLDPDAFACHSLRSGGATFASESGCLGSLIKDHGLWLSDAYLLYIHCSDDVRWTVPSVMRDSILS